MSKYTLNKKLKKINVARLFFYIVILLLYVQIVSASNATAVYRSNTGACAVNVLNCPKIRIWNSTGLGSWNAEVELATAGSTIQQAVIKYSPLNTKRIIVTSSANGNIDAYVCRSNCDNANSWVVSNNIGNISSGVNQRRFDVSFESYTGNALVVYSNLTTITTCDLMYLMLPEETMSFTGIQPICIDDTTQGTDITYSWVSLSSNPLNTSTEIIAVGFDSTNNDISGWVWNGNTWGNQNVISQTATATGGMEALAVKYAADGSLGMIIGGFGITGSVNGSYWNGASWTTATPGDVNAARGEDVQFITLKADPVTDDLQAVFTDSRPALHTGYWNGATWALTSSIDTGVDSGTARPADFEWNVTGSAGILVWDTDGAGVLLSQRPCTPQCTAATATISSYAGTGAWLALYRNPTTTDIPKILGGRLNSNFDIGSFYYNGTGYVNYSEIAITADTTVTTWEAFNIAFLRAQDIASPFWYNANKNATDIYQFNYVTYNATWNDTVNLESYIFSTNESGIWINTTPVEFRRKLNYSMNLSYIAASTGTTVGWRFFANDTSGNINMTDILNFTVGGVVWNQTNLTNGTIEAGKVWEKIVRIISYSPNNNVIVPCIGDCGIIQENFTDGTNLINREEAFVRFNCSAPKTGNYSANFSVTSNEDSTSYNLSVNCSVIDTIAPIWYNNITNDTAIYQGDVVQFNVTWNDTGELNYSIFSTNLSGIWANDSRKPLNGKNAIASNISYINQTPGKTYGWQFFANDSSGNKNQTDIFTFIVGGVIWNTSSLAFGTINAGEVFNLNTSIISYRNNNNLQLTCIGDCSVIKQNFTNGDNLNNQDSVLVKFNCTSFSAGSYSAIISMVSDEDRVADNISVSCNVQDTRAPVWNNNQTNDSAIYQGDTVKFNVSWTDNGYLNYSIFSTNLSGVWANSTPQILSGISAEGFNISYINQTPGKTYGWQFYANDSLNNINQTELFTFVVGGIVWNQTTQVIENADIGRVFNSSVTITSYKPNNNVQVSCAGNCSIIQDNFADGTNMNDLDTTTVIFNCSSLNSGNYSANFTLNSTEDAIADIISVNCTVYDFQFPKISFANPTPANDTNQSRNWFFINITVNDTNEANITFYLFNVSNLGNVNTTTLPAGTRNINFTNLPDGAYYYNSTITDYANNQNSTETRIIRLDTTPPAINLISPANDTWAVVNNVTFTYNTVDNFLGVTNCSLIINNKINSTNGTITEGISQNFTVYLDNSIGYNWSINCTDRLNNTNFSENRIVKVDTSFPAIRNESRNGTTIFNINEIICLNVTVTDNYSGVNTVIAEVNRPLSGLTNFTMSNASDGCGGAGGGVYSISILNNQEGQYNWTKTYANDTAGNMNITTPANMLNWSVVSQIFINVTMKQPLANFELNESAPNLNSTFLMECNATCRQDSTGGCENVFLYPQYNDGTWNFITTDTTTFIGDRNNATCGNLGIGASCNQSFNVSVGLSAGGSNYSLRCRGSSSNAPIDFSEEINITVNNFPIANFTYPLNGSYLNGIEILNGSYSRDDQGISRYSFELDNNPSFTSPSVICGSSDANCTFNTSSQTQCTENYFNCYLRLNVTDTDGLTNSTYITIQIDNSPPNVSLDAPVNNTWDNDGTIDFRYTPYDFNLQVCTLYHNATGWKANETNTSAVNGSQDTFTIKLNDGMYVWNVLCNDSAGNAAFNNSNLTVNVDTITPKISYNSGTQNNNSYFNKNWIFVNLTVNESNEANITFYLFNVSNLGNVNTTTLPAGARNINFTNLLDGAYYYNATILDLAGFTNYTETRIITLDTLAPAINFTTGTEGNNSYFNRNWIFINVTVNETNKANITFYLFNVSNSGNVNTTILGGGNSSINFTNLIDGAYYYNVTAIDLAGNQNFTETRRITLDTTNPSIALNAPKNNTLTNLNSLQFNYTPLDVNLKNCTLFSNFSGLFAENLTNTNPVNGTNNSFLPSTINDGYYIWNVRCYDYANNFAFNNTNYTLDIDATPPSAFNLDTPPNATESTNTTPLLNWTVTEDRHFLNYTILVDDTEDFSSINYNYTIYNNASNNSIQVIEDRAWLNNTRYFWKVIAYDTLNQSRNSTNTFVYITDNIAPIVNSILPANNSLFNDSLVDFKFNVTDTNTISSCSLIVDYEIISTAQSPGKNTTITISANLNNGAHNWTVNCTDNAGNLNSSATINVTVNSPPIIPVASTNVTAKVGNITLGSTSTTGYVDLGQEFIINKSFIIGRYTAESSAASQNINVFSHTIKFANSTHLLAERYASGVPGNVTYQLIQSDNLIVQNGSISVGATVRAVGVTLGNLGSNYKQKCFVAYTSRLNSAGTANYHENFFQTNITNATTVNFTRSVATSAATIEYFVVCFLDTARVQTGQASMIAASSTTASIPIPLNTSNSFLIFNYNASTNGLAQTSVRGRTQGSNSLFFDRQTTTGSVDIRWYMIEFEAMSNATVQNGTAASATGDLTFNTAIPNAVYLPRAISVSSVATAGAGVTYPRAQWIEKLTSTTNIEHHRGRGTNIGNIAWQAIEWPTVTTYELNPPTIDFVFPTPANNSVVGLSSVTINISLTDQHRIEKCVLEWQSVNETMLLMRDGNTAVCITTKSDLNDGAYYFRAFANDSNGNVNLTFFRNFTIDTVPPNIFAITNFLVPVYNINNLTIFANVTDNASLVDTVLIEGNWSGILANNTMNNISRKYNFTIFDRNLSSGKFVVYRIIANDTGGSRNYSAYFNFTVARAIANVSIINPAYSINRYPNETFFVNATLTAVNGSVIGCTLNVTNGTALTVIGILSKNSGDLFNGTTSNVIGWEINTTIPGTYTVNVTSNCSEGDSITISSSPIEVTESLSNLTDKLFAEKIKIDGIQYFHFSTATEIDWWLNNSEELINFNSSGTNAVWFKNRWNIIINNSIILDFTNITWDVQRTGANFIENYTFIEFIGRTPEPTLRINFTKRVYENSKTDNISFSVENIGTKNISNVKLRWIISNFDINNDGDTDILRLTNNSNQEENRSMDSSTILNYNLSNFNLTTIYFTDSGTALKGTVYWESQISRDGQKQNINNFTFTTGGNPFSVNLTFDLGNLSVGQIKALDPGAGIATPGLIQRTGALTNMTSNESGTIYIDVTAPLTDNNFATADFIHARTGDNVQVLNIVNNSEISIFDDIFLRVRVDSLGESPYPVSVFAYRRDNFTVNTTMGVNFTFVTADANTWVQINITNTAHVQDGYGHLRVRLTPNASVIGNNKKLNLDEVLFNLTDRTPPSIILANPVNDFNTSSINVMFNFTVTDKVDNNLSCNLTINGVVNITNIGVINGTYYNITIANFSEGIHLWNVTCIDDSNNQNTSATFTFTVIDGPANVSILIAVDNTSIVLNWSNVTYATSYNIHYIENLSRPFSVTPNATGITDLNWTDNTAGQKTRRFYKVTSVRGLANKTSSVTVGKYDVELEYNPQTITDWNLISIPLNLTTFVLYNYTNNGYNPPTRPDNCIRSIWRYQNVSYGWDKTEYNGSVWTPALGDENFTSLEAGKGYWFEVNKSCNFTIVGIVPIQNLTIPLNKSWNLLGWFSANISGLPTFGADPYPLTVNPVNSIKALDRYNPRTDKFEVTIHFSNWGWWPSSNNKDFTIIEPTKGYYFEVRNSSTWEHDSKR